MTTNGTVLTCAGTLSLMTRYSKAGHVEYERRQRLKALLSGMGVKAEGKKERCKMV